MLLLITLGLAAALMQAPVASQTAALRGRVLEEGARAPIVGAQVTLMPAPSSPVRTNFIQQPRTAMTDQNGRYEFDGLEAGRYDVRVRKAGFAPVHEPHMSEIHLKPGERREGLVLMLQKGAVIAGRVLDQAGEPVAEANVHAMRKPPAPSGVSSFGGPNVMATGSSAQTNDLGEFRLFSLPPGEYYVQAGRHNFDGSPGPGGTTMLPTYFPGTSDPEAAQPITVGAGQTSADVVIRMIAVSAFHVSGVVRDEAGRPVSNAMVRLVVEGRAQTPVASGVPSVPSFFMPTPENHARTDTSGKFTVRNVTNGMYTLLAIAPVVISGPRAQAGAIARGRDAVEAGGGFGASVERIYEVSSGVVGGTAAGGGFMRETSSDGTTVEYRDDTATRVPLTINDANVSGLEVIVRAPTR
jgi:protocatechuate 3,4-dioxygenase beta subunit